MREHGRERDHVHMPPVSREIFSFESTARFNLHERILLPATARFAPPPNVRGDWPGADLQQELTVAIDAYRRQLKSMLGEENAAAQRQLTAGTDQTFCSDKHPTAVPREICALYQDYRAKQWSADDASNKRWIADVRSVEADKWPAIAKRLSAVYRAPWPDTVLTVQVTAQVGGPGAAYTLSNPLITVSSSDRRHRGKRAIEILFHEASHLLTKELGDTLRAAAQQLGVSLPRGLWHASLFYLTGAVVKEHLGGDYVTYGEGRGLYERGGFKGWLPHLRAAWQPYLDGGVEMVTAAKRLVASVSSSSTNDGKARTGS